MLGLVGDSSSAVRRPLRFWWALLLLGMLGFALGGGRTARSVPVGEGPTWDNPTGDPPGENCQIVRTPIMQATASPNRGLIWPDTVVAVGTRVTLGGRAGFEITRADCSTAFQAARGVEWTMTFQAPGSALSAPPDPIADPSATATTFTAGALGIYRVTFSATPPSGVNARFNPIDLRIVAVRAPVGWLDLGPDGTLNGATGRINVLAADPRDGTLYAGSALGGVWKSSDAGASWYPITDNKRLPTLAVGALAVDPADGAIYLGTGDPYPAGGPSGGGSGVFISRDGGSTWGRWVEGGRRCGPVGAGRVPSGTVNRILLHGSDVYASGDGGVFHRAGTLGCWRRILNPAAPVTDIAVDDVSTDGNGAPSGFTRLFAAVAGRNVMLTTNPEEDSPTWSQYLLDPFAPCSQSDCATKLALASDGRLYALFGQGRAPSQVAMWVKYRSGRSTVFPRMTFQDPDQNFRPSAIACWGNPCTYDLAITVNPRDPQDVYIATVPTWRSRNGGITWSNQSGPQGWATHGDVHDFLWDPRRTGTLYQADDGGVARTSVSTSVLRWTPLNRDLNIAQFYTLGVSPTRAGLIAGGTQDNGSQQHVLDTPTSSGTGRQWAAFAGGDGGWVAYDAADTSLMFFNPSTSIGDNPGTALVENGSMIYSTQSSNAPVGYASTFFTDPLRPGVLLGVNATPGVNDPQLYVSYDAAGPGMASWGCIDPTPGNVNDSPLRIAFSEDGANPGYWVGMSNGFVYRVPVPSGAPGGPPSCATLGRTLAPAYGPASAGSSVTVINDITEDPLAPCRFYLAAASPAAAERIIRLSNPANDCSVPMTAENIGAGLPAGLQVTTVAGDPSIAGVVYAGTTRGVYAGVRTGGSWQWTRATDFPETWVTLLRARQSPSGGTGALYASTFGRGMWQRVYSTNKEVQLGLSAAGSGDGIEVSNCHGVMLDEHGQSNGHLGLVHMELDNARGDEVEVRAQVTRRGDAQPYFAMERRRVPAGKGGLDLLVKYIASDAPEGLETDGLRLQFFQAGHHTPFLETPCEFEAAWWRVDVVLVEVDAVIHQPEGGSVPAVTGMRVTVRQGDEGHALFRKTPFRIFVPHDSTILLEATNNVHGHSSEFFDRWWVNDHPAGEERKLGITVHGNVRIVGYFRSRESHEERRHE